MCMPPSNPEQQSPLPLSLAPLSPSSSSSSIESLAPSSSSHPSSGQHDEQCAKPGNLVGSTRRDEGRCDPLDYYKLARPRWRIGSLMALLVAAAACAFDRSSAVDDVPFSSDPGTRHRGKVVGPNVKAADLAAMYQSVKSEYANVESDGRWRVLSSNEDGSEVSLLQHPNDPSCPYVRMTAVMPGAVQEVWDFLDLANWEANLPKIDPYYDGLTEFGDYAHKNLEMKLARKRTKRLVTFGKRDFTFLSVSENHRDGTKVSGTVSVSADGIMPRREGYVRAYQDSVSRYEAAGNDIATGAPRTRLTMLFRLDLNDASREDGGRVPMWLYVKTAGTTAMASVQNMKRQLELHLNSSGGIAERGVGRCGVRGWRKILRIGSRKC